MFGSTNVEVRQLIWGKQCSHLERWYDIIVLADCCYFVDVQEDLLSTLLSLARETIFIFAPKRGNTLDLFVEKASRVFSVCVSDRYNDRVWEEHLKQLHNNKHYDPDIHYPLLVELTPLD